MAIDIREQGQEIITEPNDKAEANHDLKRLKNFALYSVNVRSRESARRTYKLLTGNDPVETIN